MMLTLVALAGFVLGLMAALAVNRWRGRLEEERPHAVVESPDALRLLDVLPQSYVIVDESDTVVVASTRAYSLGIVRNDRIDRPEFLQPVDRARERDGVVRASASIARPSDPTKAETHFALYAASIPAGGVLLLFEDNTEKVRLDRTRQDFVANVSHELKTPVGAIGLLAETISTVANDPEAVEHFSTRLMEENKRLSLLVQDIIELSRLQDSGGIHHSILVHVDGVVREAADRLRVTAGARQIRIVTGGVEGAQVYGDRRSLVTAVGNLLDNAVRYTRPHGRVSVAVVRGEEKNAGQVGISVVDQGAGIAPEDQQRIFERFYRGDVARTRDKGGSGLGLAIVKHVAEDHGGHVQLWSRVGQGSTFTLWIPEARLASALQPEPQKLQNQSEPQEKVKKEA